MVYLMDGHETERLHFRLLEASDFDSWLPLFRVPHVAKYLAFDTSLSPTELCKAWFDKIFHRYENDLGGMNVVVDKHTGEFIGQCGLLIQEIEVSTRMEVGYSMLPKFWGKGYASEAAIKCKNHAFENDFSPNLMSVIHTENIGSQKVAIKNGMSLEMTMKKYKGIPVHVFSIDKQHWLKSR